MNSPTMNQLVNVLLAVDKANRSPQRALGCGQDLGGLNLVYEPDHPTPYV